MTISANDMAWFAARLAVAVEEVRRLTPTMSVSQLKQALADIPGIEHLEVHYLPNGRQKLIVGDKSIEINPMASHDEIRAALTNPFIPTRNTRVSMVSPLQGIGARLKKLKHDAEQDAAKLGERIDAVGARKDAALLNSHKALNTQEADIADIESFVKEIEDANGHNGGPS